MTEQRRAWSRSGAILPVRFDIDELIDDTGIPGVAIKLVLQTGATMTIGVSAAHASDLAIGLARFLSGPDPQQEAHT